MRKQTTIVVIGSLRVKRKEFAPHLELNSFQMDTRGLESKQEITCGFLPYKNCWKSTKRIKTPLLSHNPVCDNGLVQSQGWNS